MSQSISFGVIKSAIAALQGPLIFGSRQADAIDVIGRVHPVFCRRCDENGSIPGIRRPRKCPRCGGAKEGYRYGGAIFWTGWAPQTRAIDALEYMEEKNIP